MWYQTEPAEDGEVSPQPGYDQSASIDSVIQQDLEDQSSIGVELQYLDTGHSNGGQQLKDEDNSEDEWRLGSPSRYHYSAQPPKGEHSEDGEGSEGEEEPEGEPQYRYPPQSRNGELLGNEGELENGGKSEGYGGVVSESNYQADQPENGEQLNNGQGSEDGGESMDDEPLASESRLLPIPPPHGEQGNYDDDQRKEEDLRSKLHYPYSSRPLNGSDLEDEPELQSESQQIQSPGQLQNGNMAEGEQELKAVKKLVPVPGDPQDKNEPGPDGSGFRYKYGPQPQNSRNGAAPRQQYQKPRPKGSTISNLSLMGSDRTNTSFQYITGKSNWLDGSVATNSEQHDATGRPDAAELGTWNMTASAQQRTQDANDKTTGSSNDAKSDPDSDDDLSRAKVTRDPLVHDSGSVVRKRSQDYPAPVIPSCTATAPITLLAPISNSSHEGHLVKTLVNTKELEEWETHELTDVSLFSIPPMTKSNMDPISISGKELRNTELLP